MRYVAIFLLVAYGLSLGSCSEARYAAHLAKQVSLPTDTPQSQGTFKVGNSYKVNGKRYYPKETYNYTETGIASWYGPGFHGKRTANGEVFSRHELTAAHKTLQMPALVRVTNLQNGRSLILRVNDRGPYAHGRILDVSERAAELLGFKSIGTARIKLQVLGPESRQIAQAAKRGQDTRGTEVALNQNRVPQQISQKPYPSQQRPAAYQTASARPVSSEPLGEVQGHRMSDGRFLPDPVVQTAPVTPTRIFVQAGAFSVENNALNLAKKLETVGPSKVYLSQVNNHPFYRVRLGPYQDTGLADQALNTLISAGNYDAHIVID